MIEFKKTMDPVILFRAVTVDPIALRGFGKGFMLGGQFKIELKFNPSIDCSRYEYRQFIKGSCTLTKGTFGTSTPSRATWKSTSAAYDAKKDFPISGGLQTYFTEDCGPTSLGTRTFGYRSSSPLKETGCVDRYLPKQSSGHEYEALDTFGIRGDKKLQGLHIELHLHYMGQVVDTKNKDRIIRTLHWRFDGDDFIV